jgi:hypothetical protein
MAPYPHLQTADSGRLAEQADYWTSVYDLFAQSSPETFAEYHDFP